MIEMIISFGILAVISAFTVAGFRTGARADELRFDAQFLASEYRRAQTSVIAGVTLNVCVAGTKKGRLCPLGAHAECGDQVEEGGIVIEVPTCQVSVPPGGYGIHVQAMRPNKELETANRAVILFADANANRKFDSSSANRPSEAVRTIYLSTNDYVTATEPDHPEGVDKGLDIIFAPPDGEVWIQGSNSVPLAKITLRHRQLDTPDHDADKYVTVMALSGQISAY
jgi:hypothetical protein